MRLNVPAIINLVIPADLVIDPPYRWIATAFLTPWSATRKKKLSATVRDMHFCDGDKRLITAKKNSDRKIYL